MSIQHKHFRRVSNFNIKLKAKLVGLSVAFTADPILSVLCLMVFRLRLAECRLQLELTDHDPNPPQDVWQREPAVAAQLDDSPSIKTSIQFVTCTFQLNFQPISQFKRGQGSQSLSQKI